MFSSPRDCTVFIATASDGWTGFWPGLLLLGYGDQQCSRDVGSILAHQWSLGLVTKHRFGGGEDHFGTLDRYIYCGTVDCGAVAAGGYVDDDAVINGVGSAKAFSGT